MSATSSFGRSMAQSSERLRSRRLGISADWTRQQGEWTGCGADLAGSDPQITGSGCQATVPEEQLNAPDICAGFKQMNCESVSKRMRRNWLADARGLACLLASSPYRECADVPAGDFAGKEPVAGFVHSPPRA